MSAYPIKQIVWDDLPEYIAVIAALEEGIDQCSLQNVSENREEAHLFLLRHGLLAITDLNIPDDAEPSARLMAALVRVVIEHRRAAKEGRSLL